MNLPRISFALLLLVSACGDDVASNHDLGGAADLSTSPSPDLATSPSPDLSMAPSPDLSTAPDLSAASDLSMAGDLAQTPPDLIGADLYGVCNDLTDSVVLVTAQQVPQNPPAPAGGTIVDATYDLTALTIYTGPNGASGPTGLTLRYRLRVQNGQLDFRAASNGSPEQTGSATYTVANSAITAAVTCPKAGTPSTTAYSADATHFIVFSPTSPPEVLTFTKAF